MFWWQGFELEQSVVAQQTPATALTACYNLQTEPEKQSTLYVSVVMTNAQWSLSCQARQMTNHQPSQTHPPTSSVMQCNEPGQARERRSWRRRASNPPWNNPIALPANQDQRDEERQGVETVVLRRRAPIRAFEEGERRTQPPSPSAPHPQ